jgi:hypothetical protein
MSSLEVAPPVRAPKAYFAREMQLLHLAPLPLREAYRAPSLGLAWKSLFPATCPTTES